MILGRYSNRKHTEYSSMRVMQLSLRCTITRVADYNQLFESMPSHTSRETARHPAYSGLWGARDIYDRDASILSVLRGDRPHMISFGFSCAQKDQSAPNAGRAELYDANLTGLGRLGSGSKQCSSAPMRLGNSCLPKTWPGVRY